MKLLLLLAGGLNFIDKNIQLVGAEATPVRPTDSFSPPCGAFLSDPSPPPAGLWRRWSDAATWAGQFPSGIIPGVSSSALGVNVTVPCGQRLLLDVASLQLAVLNIRGFLKLLDSPSLPLISVSASFIIVEGQLTAGSPSQQFSQKAVFTLMPNPNARANFLFSANAPAEPAFPRDFGHKAFVVVGGQVRLHGMPGGSSTPSWAKLTATANAGDYSITVDADVSNWPVGSEVVIASTDLYFDHEEVRKITAVTLLSPTSTRLSLDAPLTLMHFGDPVGIPDGIGGFVDERAEVALLARNIRITGLDERAPFQFQGGHFMIFHTQTAQFLEGVEFFKLGQQGSLGRYSIHFHLAGDQEDKSLVKKNLIRDSKQRCLVVHATFGLKAEENVAYNTAGHCFMTEEGGETGNSFIRNLGIKTKAVERPIILPGASATDETDTTPATFWISHPNNNYIGNVAAGSEDSGFWLELRERVRGISRQWSLLNNTIPLNADTIGVFDGNVAHSNQFVGFRMYPNGFMPRRGATVDSNGDYWSKPVPLSMGGFNLYKNMDVGAFIHDTDYFTLSNSTFADNTWGAHLNEVQGVTLSNNKFIGATVNLGNPSDCTEQWGSCGPISGCTYPLRAGQKGREVGWDGYLEPMFGVVLDQNRMWEEGDLSNLVSSSWFANFNSMCRPDAAVAVGGNRQSYWNSGHGVEKLKFAAGTRRIYMSPQIDPRTKFNQGEVARTFTLRDIDGSIGLPSPAAVRPKASSSAGIAPSPPHWGYIIANDTFLLPPSSLPSACSPLPSSNAFSCPSLCYRTLLLRYAEPSFSPYPSEDTPLTRKRGDFSSVTITRLSDSRATTLDGNLHQFGVFDGAQEPNERFFSIPILTGQEYNLAINPPTANPSFAPSKMTLRFTDGVGCNGGATFRVAAMGGRAWTVAEGDGVGWSPCPGVSTSSLAVAFSYPCINAAAQLRLSLTPLFSSSSPPLTLSRSSVPPAVCTATSPSRCGLLAQDAEWFYDESNRNLQPTYPQGPAFYNPLYPTTGWKKGRGVLGYVGWNWGMLNTKLAEPDGSRRRVWYFKTSFSLSKTSCYSSLLLDLLVDDGVVVYLNNQQVLRSNMPAGPLSNKTQALTSKRAYDDDSDTGGFFFSSSSLPLTASSTTQLSLAEGTNHIAAEVHTSDVGDEGWNVNFAIRASLLLSNPTCSAALKRAEVCDGVDNDADGTVDINPSTGRPFQRPCSTACGTGTETCIRGAFQGCTAAPVNQEICNGIDDDCDGLVDNGPARLNCPQGSVCMRGKCQAVGPLKSVAAVWGRGSSGWLYYDKGGNMGAQFPQWTSGVITPAMWSTGSAPFGSFPTNSSLSFATPLRSLAGKWVTRYFLKSFTLTASQLDTTYGFSFNIRKVDGALVFINGVEVFRVNMPAGAVTFATLAAQWGSSQSTDDDDNVFSFVPYAAERKSGSNLKVGLNWVAVEVHANDLWSDDVVFDLDLIRHIKQTCSSLPSAPPTCVLYPPRNNAIVKPRSLWRYLDASRPLPAGNWFSPLFSDSLWLQGASPLGNGGWGDFGTKIKFGSVMRNGRVAYFFRQTVLVSDSTCIFSITINLLANDGAIVYINGVEAIRYQMPAGPISMTTKSQDWPDWEYKQFNLSGGWLKPGNNLVAVELHQSINTNDDYVFDLNLVGQRDGATCTPLQA